MARLDERQKKTLLRVVAILFAIGITVAIVLLGDRVEEFAQYGLAGVFVITLLGNATLILPAPGLAFVFAIGGVLPPVQVGLVAGVAGTLGEMTGYLAGYAGSAVIEDRERYEKIAGQVKKYGMVPIFVLALIPSPFFDLAGIAAGVLKMPVWQFLLATWGGKTIKMMLTALAGAGSAPLIRSFLERLLGS